MKQDLKNWVCFKGCIVVCITSYGTFQGLYPDGMGSNRVRVLYRLTITLDQQSAATLTVWALNRKSEELALSPFLCDLTSVRCPAPSPVGDSHEGSSALTVAVMSMIPPPPPPPPSRGDDAASHEEAPTLSTTAPTKVTAPPPASSSTVASVAATTKKL